MTAPKKPRRIWTADDIAEFVRLYPDTPTAELAQRLDRTVESLYGMASKLEITKSDAYLAEKKRQERERLTKAGVAHRFPKGHVPSNKGLRRPGWTSGRMAETQFKKGQRSINWKPPGSTRIDTEGYVLVKVAETGLFQWRFLHLDVWRLHHGPRPKGMCIAFKDGNKSNCEYTNLELITQAENMLRNSIHKYPPQIVPALAALSELKKEISKHEQEEQT